MEHAPPPLFVRGPTPLVRLLFFGTLAVFLMVLDARFKFMDPLRQGLFWIVYPVQRVASLPIDLFDRVSDFFVSQARLQQENAELTSEKLRSAQDLLRFQAVLAENKTLRAMLGAREHAGGHSIFAEIAYLGRDPFSRKVIIDKGSQSGVELGSPVIDAGGVIGQVTRVHPLVAEVTLVIDKEQATPIEVVRNGLRGVAFGSGDGSTMELRYMAANAEINTGDVLVTSGIDSVYPFGLPVATVTRIDKDASYAFARIICTPTGGPGQNKQVLVLSRSSAAPAPYPEGEVAAPARGSGRTARRERRP
jgi:rod shape-determining protein MreC